MNNVTIFNDIKTINLPKLEDIQYYIYALENDLGYIKIGITKNISQRTLSLSGSNGGGGRIIRVLVSQPTYLKTLERIFHTIYRDYRIEGTEWFKDILFEDVAAKMNEVFNSNEYIKCNELRKNAGGYRYKS